MNSDDYCCRAHTKNWDKMYLCKKCGNKRCPHATNCSLACTNSNEPGQKGSHYEGATDPPTHNWLEAGDNFRRAPKGSWDDID